MNKMLFSAAMAGIFAAGVTAAQAQSAAPAPVKCYGIAKAGKNDCKGNNHSCKGQSKMDNDKGEFMLTDPATCTKDGGSTSAPNM